MVWEDSSCYFVSPGSLSDVIAEQVNWIDASAQKRELGMNIKRMIKKY